MNTRRALWVLTFLCGPIVPLACSSSSGPGTGGGEDSSLPDVTADGSDGGSIDQSAEAEAETSEVDAPSEASLDAPHEASEAGSADAAPDGMSGDADAAPAGPVALASDAPNARQLAVDGVDVFWIDYVAGDGGPVGRVMSVPVAGGTEATLATTSGSKPQYLAIDSANVYWSDDSGALRQVAKQGGSVTTLVSTGASAQIAANGGEVYYAVSGTSVSRVGIDAGAGQSLSTSGNPIDLVVLAGNVYWANATLGLIEYVSTSTGGTPSTLVAPDPEAGAGEFVSTTPVQNLITDGTSLYWNRSPAGSYAGAIMAVAAGGGSPSVVVNTSADTPFSIATDGSQIYYLDIGATNSLMRLPIGSSPATLTTTSVGSANIAGTSGPTIAVDGTSVYWLNPPQVMRMAK